MSAELVTIPAEVEAEAAEARVVEANSRTIVVTTNEEYERAGAYLLSIKQQEKAMEDQRVRLKAPILAAGKGIDDFFRGPANLLKSAIQNVDRAMGGYRDKLRKEREAEERRVRDAQAAAQRKADEEAAKLREQAKAIEEEDPFAALAMESEADFAPVPEPFVMPAMRAVEAPKVAGLSVTTTWTFEITDAAQVPNEWKTINEQAIGAYARSMKDKAVIPGVRFFTRESMGRK